MLNKITTFPWKPRKGNFELVRIRNRLSNSGTKNKVVFSGSTKDQKLG